MKKIVGVVMLGKNNYVLDFFLLLKLVWSPFSYSLFTKYSTNEADKQNQKLSFLTSFLKFQSCLYNMGWAMLRKVYFTEREKDVTERRRKKKRSLVLVGST